MTEHLHETREFFAPRAAAWDQRFHDDEAVYRAAITEGMPAGATVAVDVGCGTGRAIPLLRAAMEPDAIVLGVDATPEMLAAARRSGRDRDGALVLADVLRLPVAAGRVDLIFAAGVLEHVPEPPDLLRVLAEVARPGGRLAVFHPIGRATLAQRHGREVQPGELFDPSVLPGVLARAGWETNFIDDADERYLALATKA